MDCAYFDAGECRSCSLLPLPYAEQLAGKQARVRALLPPMTWLSPVASAESGFRNKAKMVVAGTTERPTLGILDGEGRGIDLRGCGLHGPGLVAALPHLAAFIARARLTPYDVSARAGELKYLLITESPAGELMVRFVCRSQEPVTRIGKHLGWLHERLPSLRVVSVNIQPEHKAVLEGEREIVLSAESALVMSVNGIDLRLRPQSFFQTNTEVAAALYRQAADWADRIDPATVWDLYCGVGGFARHLAGDSLRRPVRRPRRITGIEISEEAVAAANQGIAGAATGLRFVAADTADWVRDRPAPDLVVVNPPRRGIGGLAAVLEASDVTDVLYSSCRAQTLAKDLAAMPSLRPVSARLLDMFPQTEHYEVLVWLHRGPGTMSTP